MLQQINQPVDVLLAFKGDERRVTPLKVQWGKHVFSITKLGFRHPTSRGKRMIHVFDVFDGTHSLRLEFDAESLVWTLTAITDEAILNQPPI